MNHYNKPNTSLLTKSQNAKIISAIILSVIFFFTVANVNNVYATPVFSIPQQLDSNSPFGGSQVAVSGSNVYSIWLDQCGDVRYARSTDDGVNFNYDVFPISGDTGCGGLTGNERIATVGSNVYVVWVDYGATGIFLQKSNDGGFTFNGVDFLDNSTPFPVTPTSISPEAPTFVEISATGDYLYVVWIDGSGNVQLAASNDNGVNFEIFNLGSSSTSSSPVVASSGDNAFVAWQDSSNDIIVKKITHNSGFDVSASQNLSGTGTASGPKIAAAGNNVYVAWQDTEFADYEIYFSKSADNGDAFNGITQGTPGIPINLSGNTGESVQPDIAAVGDNVFVVWRDNLFSGSTNYEIMLQSSSNGGTTINGASPGIPVNLSNNNGNSGSSSSGPKISANGSEAYVVWQDDSLDPGSFDVLFRTILDDGTIGGIKNINQSTISSEFPKVASSLTNVSVIWDSPFTNVSFNNAISNNVDVSLDQTDYLQGDTAVITVIALSGTGPISVDVSSSSDPGFSINANEIGSSGVYTAEITFTTGITDGPSAILKAPPGDQIFITEPSSTQNTFASIISSGTISFTPVTTAYDRGAIAHVTVTDATANLDPNTAESIIVDVTSTVQTVPTLLTLQETGPDTGIFGNTGNNKLIFTTSDNLLSSNSNLIINQQHLGANITPEVDTILETITSTSDPVGITLTLTETGGSTGMFQGVLTLSDAGSVSGSTIYALPGDVIQVIRGAVVSNVLVIPSTNNVAAVLVNADPDVDTVTISYGASSTTADIEQQFASGGGGGGISRAGLVVQAVGSISLFGGGGGSTSSGPPLFDSSFTLKQDGTAISSGSSTLAVGKQSAISMGFKLPGGLNNLDHVGLYANIGTGQGKYDSDTYIYFDKYKTPQITIHDPHGFFKSVNVDVTEPTKSNLSANFAFDFAKSLDNNNVVFEAWNLKRESALKEIPGLLKVTDTKIETPTEPETIHIETPQKTPIPEWIKSNAAWWGKGAIDDKEFTNGIGYMIQKQIINVPGLLKKNISPDVSLMDQPAFTPVVPAWVKNNALWWSEDKLTDDDFITGIKYLLEKGIIQVNS